MKKQKAESVIRVNAPHMSIALKQAAELYMSATMLAGVKAIYTNGVNRTADVIWLAKYIYG